MQPVNNRFWRGGIQNIKGKLSNIQVIDTSSVPHGDSAIFGSTVTKINLESDKTGKYKIVGDDDADVKLLKFYIIADCTCVNG
jgi:transcription elongation factor GreA|tara:strand:+ start:74 stop:322 length:249 start_codon:yes stop_codon:yes gene_type:complete